MSGQAGTPAGDSDPSSPQLSCLGLIYVPSSGIIEPENRVPEERDPWIVSLLSAKEKET